MAYRHEPELHQIAQASDACGAAHPERKGVSCMKDPTAFMVLLNRFTDLASRIQVCRAGHSRGASAMCSDCRLLKLVDMFERDRDTIDGLWHDLWEPRR